MRRRQLRLLGLVIGLLGILNACEESVPARPPESAPPAEATEELASPGLAPRAWDSPSAVPTLLLGRQVSRLGSDASLAERGEAHLLDLAPRYGLVPDDLASAEVTQVRPSPEGGGLVVVRQRVGDLEVHGQRLSLLIDARGDLVAAGGQLFATDHHAPFVLDESTCASAALAAHFDGVIDGSALTEGVVAPNGSAANGYSRYALSARGTARGYDLTRPMRARRVLFPRQRVLLPACYVELWVPDATTGSALFSYVVSAVDGAILERRARTFTDAFDYAVYADPANRRPWDGPQGNITPNLTRMLGGSLPPVIVPSVVRVEGLNRNPSGLADPWLPSGATVTTGNNIDAYADLSFPDGFSSGDIRGLRRPDGFSHVYSFASPAEANTDQQRAAIDHLFYVTNWLHDYFYDLGFDEAAGNAQENNFGRGGFGGDRLLAEANDFDGRNNANMSTPADGDSPVMQMFIFDGAFEAGVDSGADTFDELIFADFGPVAFDVTAPLLVASDGTAPASDGCQPIVNAMAGRIALIDRGTCSFETKIVNAEAAGAVGVIVLNDRNDGLPVMGGDLGAAVDIGSVMVTQADGAVLRARTGMTARLYREENVSVPGALDSQIVVHEFGHYLHMRSVECNSSQCGAESEGWGDFLSLFVLMAEGDALDGIYPVGGFADTEEDPYFGIRRVPYSANPVYNALSFRHITNGQPLPTSHLVNPTEYPNSEFHHAGEIWASMMFDAMVAMLVRSREAGSPYDFEEAKRRMGRYVVTGMQLAPTDPTYTEQRDAIIAAAAATDAEDARRIARAFAGRGAGSCAVSPSRYSDSFNGVVEDFTLAPTLAISSFSVVAEGAGVRCDADIVLDPGEDAVARVVIQNVGIAPASGATLNLTTTDPRISMPSGASRPVPALAVGQQVTLLVPVRMAASPVGGTLASFSVALSGVSTCTATPFAANATVASDATSTTTESFEAATAWVAETRLAGTGGVWSVRTSVMGDPDRVLRAAGREGTSDTAVSLPRFTASATQPVIVRFQHRYRFEFDGEYWDGGVIEVSLDGGAFQDVSLFTSPGYTVTLADPGGPLGGRAAYGGNNPASPAANSVTLNFGTAFAGRQVELRFRVGSDQAVASDGWEIDELSVAGATEGPFVTFSSDTSDCGGAPIANAGPDQVVDPGALVHLDGTGSSDPNGDPLTYVWTLMSVSPGLVLMNANTTTPSFIAPSAGVLTFRLRVGDGTALGSDEVIISVRTLADAGGPMPLPDAGVPPLPDAGPVVVEDAGTTADPDAGVTVSDAGAIDEDAGATDEDAGIVEADAGVIAEDAGVTVPETDAGTIEPDGGVIPETDGGCGCRTARTSGSSSPATSFAIGLVGLGLFIRRRRRSSARR